MSFSVTSVIDWVNLIFSIVMIALAVVYSMQIQRNWSSSSTITKVGYLIGLLGILIATSPTVLYFFVFSHRWESWIRWSLWIRPLGLGFIAVGTIIYILGLPPEVIEKLKKTTRQE